MPVPCLPLDNVGSTCGLMLPERNREYLEQQETHNIRSNSNPSYVLTSTYRAKTSFTGSWARLNECFLNALFFGSFHIVCSLPLYRHRGAESQVLRAQDGARIGRLQAPMLEVHKCLARQYSSPWWKDASLRNTIGYNDAQ